MKAKQLSTTWACRVVQSAAQLFRLQPSVRGEGLLLHSLLGEQGNASVWFHLMLKNPYSNR